MYLHMQKTTLIDKITFRDLSWVAMFPLIAKINNAIDHVPSDDEIEFRNM